MLRPDQPSTAASEIKRCRTRAFMSDRSLGAHQLDVQTLDLLSRPRRFAQKGQARLDARITLETADVDALGQARPFVVSHQRRQDLFEGDTVQRIGSVVSHGRPWAK